jgi:hypothetical protein
VQRALGSRFEFQGLCRLECRHAPMQPDDIAPLASGDDLTTAADSDLVQSKTGQMFLFVASNAAAIQFDFATELERIKRASERAKSSRPLRTGPAAQMTCAVARAESRQQQDCCRPPHESAACPANLRLPASRPRTQALSLSATRNGDDNWACGTVPPMRTRTPTPSPKSCARTASTRA